jgi:hypothetical protein|uniref:Uncharacterized protein n=1 Tax=viral metagenome TaxID=1070528 RepID=A0A6C0IRD8_9ZZZZ
MFSDIVVGYNKNDFFYITAEENGYMPSDEKCKTILEDTEFDHQSICKTDNEEQRDVFNSDQNSSKCIERELCINKQNVTRIDNVQNNHSGSEEKHQDYVKQFKSTQLDTLNLGIGITALIFFIYRARNINI